ncbi:MAG: hypothetical protein ABIO94_10605, partial [Opitutaceae bacterium]
KEQLVGFQADEAMKAAILARARVTSDGNVSAHLRQLATDDLAAEGKKPTAFEWEVLSKLAKIYGGYFAPTLEKQLEGVNQPKLLHDVLAQIADYFARGGRVEDLAVVEKQHTSFHPLPDGFRNPLSPSYLEAHREGPAEARAESARLVGEIVKSRTQDAPKAHPEQSPRVPAKPDEQRR